MADFFENKFDSFADRFSLLDSMIDDNNHGGTYFANIKTKYCNFVGINDDISLSKFYLRWYKAKKLIYASAQMFVDAECVKKADCVVAHYFLLYYSLLHAMQANLMIDMSNNNELVVQLSHDQIKTQFESLFCKSNGLFNKSVIIQDFEKLRNLRELYSYAMPFNMSKDSICDTDRIEEHILACFQLFNLHSKIIRTYCPITANIDSSENEYTLRFYLYSLCNRIKNDGFEDEADADFWYELRKFGGQIEPLSITYEHDYDEYGGYDSRIKEMIGFPTNYKRLNEALSFVYSSFT